MLDNHHDLCLICSAALEWNLLEIDGGRGSSPIRKTPLSLDREAARHGVIGENGYLSAAPLIIATLIYRKSRMVVADRFSTQGEWWHGSQ